MEFYVNQAPFNATKDDIVAHFEKAGCEVTACRILTHKDTGKFKGIAFVEVATNSAERALALHRKKLKGRQINVRPSKTPEELSAIAKRTAEAKLSRLAAESQPKQGGTRRVDSDGTSASTPKSHKNRVGVDNIAERVTDTLVTTSKPQDGMAEDGGEVHETRENAIIDDGEVKKNSKKKANKAKRDKGKKKRSEKKKRAPSAKKTTRSKPLSKKARTKKAMIIRATFGKK